MINKYREGEPCGHTGCLHHLSHPCEGCGRVGGVEIMPKLKYSVPVDIKPVELKNPPDFTSIDKAYVGQIITPVEFKIEDGKLYAKDEESGEWVVYEPEEVTAG